MKNSKWVIGIDLDGTLLRGREFGEHHKVSPLTRRVLEEMDKQGHIVAIDTGRSYFASKGVFTSIGINSPIINFAGAHIHKPMDASFKEIIEPINNEVIKKILFDDINSKDIMAISIDTTTRSYFKSDKLPELKEGLIKSKVRHYPDNEFVDVDELDVTAINIVYDCNSDGMWSIIDRLQKEYGKHINVVDWISTTAKDMGLFGVEINSASLSKGKALLRLAESLGVPYENTMGIGDSPNDRDLMATPKVGVAMKNARKEIIDLANEVTEHTNTEEGVAKYLIKKFNLDINIV